MIAERLPEPRLVPFLEPQAADPLGALPEVSRGDYQACGATVLGRQRRPVVLVRDEGLAVQYVGQGQVRGVAAVGIGDDEGRAFVELHALEEGIHAHAAPAHVELGPLGHAADIHRPVASGERLELLPAPRDRLFEQPLDGERPLVERGSRGQAGGEDREVAGDVLPGRN